VDAAVVELDPLPDAVRPTAQNDHLGPVGYFGLVAGRVSAVEVGRMRLELGGACVDAVIDRENTQRFATRANVEFGRRTEDGGRRKRFRTNHSGAFVVRRSSFVALKEQFCHLRIRKPVLFCLCKHVTRQRFQGVLRDLTLNGDNPRHLIDKPRIISRRRRNFVHMHPLAQRIPRCKDTR
jgi:hypothetical protein